MKLLMMQLICFFFCHLEALRVLQSTVPQQQVPDIDLTKSQADLESGLDSILESDLQADAEFDYQVDSAAYELLSTGMKVRHVGDEAPDACQLRKSEKATHIIESAGGESFIKAMAASAWSIIEHTKSPENLVVHLIVKEEDAEMTAKHFNMSKSCHIRTVGKAQVAVQYVESVNPSEIRPTKLKKERLGHISNYIRFAMDKFVEEEDAVGVWMDSDMLIYGDVVQKANELRMNPSKVASVVERAKDFSKNKVGVSPGKCPELPQLGKTFSSGNYFQANIMIVKMEEWKKRDFNSLIKNLIHCQDKGAWISGSQIMADMLLQYPQGKKQIIDLGYKWSNTKFHECTKMKKDGASHFIHKSHKPWGAYLPGYRAPCEDNWDEAYDHLQAAASTPN